jgi:apolipoprotein N-acyltransferase
MPGGSDHNGHGVAGDQPAQDAAQNVASDTRWRVNDSKTPTREKAPRAHRFRRGCRAHWRSLSAATLCGAALPFAMPPTSLWWLAPLCVAGLSMLLAGRGTRHAALLGLLFGLTFALIEFFWLSGLAFDAWPILSIGEAAYFVPMAIGIAAVSRLRAAPIWQACLWVAQELVRDRTPFGGLSWARLAFSQSHSPYTRIVALGGAPLLTFAVALTGTALAALLLTAAHRLPRPPHRLTSTDAHRPGARFAAVWLLAAIAGPLVALAVPGPSGGLAGDAPNRRVDIALVQGNVPRIGLDFYGQGEAVVVNHVNETLKLARQVDAGTRPRPQAVIWPEDSVDIDPFTDAQAHQGVETAVHAVGVPVLVGAVVTGPTPTTGYNEGIVWSPTTGPGATYVKQHLVPFGEYVPFRAELQPIFTELANAGQYLPGHHNGVLTLGPARIGDVICFEVAYDNIVRQAVRSGGQVIVVQTNNADYNHTWQPSQQLAIEQLRAVEHGRAVLVAATSGISAMIAPDGTIVSQTKQFTPALLQAEVGEHTTLTLADRVGAWPEWLLSIAGALAWLLATVIAWRRDGRGPFRTARVTRREAQAPARAPARTAVQVRAGVIADAAAREITPPLRIESAPDHVPLDEPERPLPGGAVMTSHHDGARDPAVPTPPRETDQT